MDLTPMLIGGTWRPAQRTGRTEDVTSPFDGSVVGTVPVAGPQDVEAALDGRRDAVRFAGGALPPTSGCGSCFARRSWPTSGPSEIASTISAEAGKTITEATRRGRPLRRDDPAGGVRGHPALRRHAAAGRQPGNRPGQDRLHPPPAVRRRGGDLTRSTTRPCWSCTRSRRPWRPATRWSSSRPGPRR